MQVPHLMNTLYLFRYLNSDLHSTRNSTIPVLNQICTSVFPALFYLKDFPKRNTLFLHAHANVFFILSFAVETIVLLEIVVIL